MADLDGEWLWSALIGLGWMKAGNGVGKGIDLYGCEEGRFIRVGLMGESH